MSASTMSICSVFQVGSNPISDSNEGDKFLESLMYFINMGLPLTEAIELAMVDFVTEI